MTGAEVQAQAADLREAAAKVRAHARLDLHDDHFDALAARLDGYAAALEADKPDAAEVIERAVVVLHGRYGTDTVVGIAARGTVRALSAAGLLAVPEQHDGTKWVVTTVRRVPREGEWFFPNSRVPLARAGTNFVGVADVIDSIAPLGAVPAVQEEGT